MKRHFRRGDSTKWGRTSTGIRKNVPRTGPRSRRGSTSCWPSMLEIRVPGHLLPWRHLTSTGFPELPGGLNAERIAGVDQRKGGGVDLRSFMHNETGQGLVEYALIIAVIAVAVIVAMLFLQDQLSNVFSNIGNNLT